MIWWPTELDLAWQWLIQYPCNVDIKDNMWFVDETKYKVNIIHAWFNSKHNKKMHAKIVFRNIYTLTHSREKGTTPTTLAILKPWPPQPPEKNEPEQWVVWKNLSETTICKKKLFVKTCKVWKKSSSLFAKKN